MHDEDISSTQPNKGRKEEDYIQAISNIKQYQELNLWSNRCLLHINFEQSQVSIPLSLKHSLSLSDDQR